MMEVQQFGPTDALELNFTAGGPYALAGDYMWSSERMPYSIAGQWGILRVLDPDARSKQKTAADGILKEIERKPEAVMVSQRE